MQRERAIGYSTDARPAGSTGARPGHYAPGQADDARPIPGVTNFVEESPVSPVRAICSATTRAGNACKARPVHGSELCIGHTRQMAAS